MSPIEQPHVTLAPSTISMVDTGNIEFERRRFEIEERMRLCWRPNSGQIPIINSLLYQFYLLVFLQCGRKLGKALCIDTPIPTPNGYKRLGDIEAGDIVFNERGEQIAVLFAHEPYEEEVYRFNFCNGSHLDACKDHRWLTWTKSDRKNFRRNLSYCPSVKSSHEIFETQVNGKEYNHSIPYADPINICDSHLPIPAYMLGLWLGDGHTNNSRISTADDEILEYIKSLGYGISYYSGCDYGITGGFKKLLVDNCLLKNKHIPINYLNGSFSQRLDLLQGLMDTDGWIGKDGEVCEYYSVIPGLADGVFQLVASLGMKPIRKVKKTSLNGERKKDCHVIRFKAYLPVFRLKRKLARLNIDTVKFKHHTIKSVEKTGERKVMRCLTVSGESKLYLAGESMIPTHNTDLAIWVMYYFGMLFPRSQIYYIADTMKHGGELLWHNRRLPEFFLRLKRLPGEPDSHYMKRLEYGKSIHHDWVGKSNNSEMRLHLSSESWIKVDGAENYANADGIEPDLLVYDEFKHHDPRFHEAMEPNLEVKKAPLLILGTPPDNYDNYYCKIADYSRKGDDCSFFELPSFLNSFLYPKGEQDESFQKQCRKYDLRGEEDVKLRELYAKIVIGGSSSIFPVFDAPPLDYVTNRFVEHTRHVRPHDEIMRKLRDYPKDWEYFASFDAGTVKCFAVIFIAINKYTKECLIVDEIYEEDQKKTSTKSIFPRARKIWRDIFNDDDEWTKIYDNAAAWFALEVSNEFDTAMFPSIKDVNKKDSRLSMIKDMMIRGYLKVSDRCQKFVWEVTNYRKDEKGKIPKENDHLLDGFRYALAGAGYNQVPEEHFVENSERRGYTIEEDMFNDYMGDNLEEFYE